MAEKFEIELEDCYERFGSGDEDSPARLYRVKGFRTLVFDENGLEKLRALNKKQQSVTRTKTKMTTLEGLPAGSFFKLGGIEWTILDTDYQGGVLVLAKDPIQQRAFDEGNCNDWRKSSARKYLNEEWRKDFEEKAKVELFGFNRDLTSDDGLKDYGTCFDYVSLITCDEYRRYRDFIPNQSDWWWTLTPWSTPRFGYSRYVRYVDTDGSLGSGIAYGGSSGLAPALVLPSYTEVAMVLASSPSAKNENGGTNEADA